MSQTMQAVVFHGEGRWGVEEVAAPRVQADDEVLLKVDRASICGTDLHILSVPPGHPATPGSILGHEYTATVVESGRRAEHLKPGDRVVVDPNVTCGLCQYCRLGMSNACENMTTLGIFIHGGLAQYNVAPARALHKIRGDVPPDRATLAEPLTCVLHAFEQSRLEPGESVAILGGGPIGLLFLMLAKASGAGKVFVVEPVEFRRNIAEKFGADAALDPRQENPANAIRAATGIGADIVIDAAGTLLPEALAMVRRRGRVILFGMNLNSDRAVSQYAITRHEISIMGSFIQTREFPKAVRILESGILLVERLATHHLRLPDVGQGFDALRSGEAIKVVVEP